MDSGRRMANTAADASRLSQQQYQQTEQNLAPYRQTGAMGLSALGQYLGLGGVSGGSPAQPSGPAPTQDQFMKTVPGQISGMYGDVRGPGGVGPSTTQFDQSGYDAAMAAYNGGQQQQSSQGSGLNLNAPGLKAFSLADFQASPAYQFNLQQGQQAIDKASNARGNMYAPQTLQDLSKFSQGMASNEFTNAYNMYNQNQGNVFSRLNTMAGIGQNAAVQQGGFGAASAGAQGNYGIMGGEATSAGYTGAVGNALNGGTQAYNNYLQNQILQRQQQSTYGQQYGGDAYGGSSGWAP
jgi:hypothetical protein